MNISLIAAMAHHRIIGNNNQLPWHLPADLQHFKALTLGKPVIMGRKTFEAIGRPLPNRSNIVLTSNPKWSSPGVIAVTHWEAAIAACSAAAEIMVIGGAQLYEFTLAKASRLYLTYIDANIEGDACFPQWDSQEWQEIERSVRAADDKNPYDMAFVTLQRVK
jgi:dihydrofolate reductase